jgi:hypothetical protein
MEVDDRTRVLTLRLLEALRFHNPVACQLKIREIAESPSPNFCVIFL